MVFSFFSDKKHVMGVILLMNMTLHAQFVPFGFLNGPSSCNLPWGGSIDNGQNVTAYSSATPAGVCTDFDEVRNCSGGSLSGSFTIQSCTNGCVSTPWGSVTHGYSNTAYSTSAPVGVACTTVDQTRTCSNGSFSGSFASTSCNNGCAATTLSNCSVGARAHGSSSGSCASGYSGSCSYSCNNGSNTLVSNNCAASAPSCAAYGGQFSGGFCRFVALDVATAVNWMNTYQAAGASGCTGPSMVPPSLWGIACSTNVAP